MLPEEEQKVSHEALSLALEGIRTWDAKLIRAEGGLAKARLQLGYALLNLDLALRSEVSGMPDTLTDKAIVMHAAERLKE